MCLNICMISWQFADIVCALIAKLDPSAIGEVTPDMDEIDVGRLAHEGARRLGVQTFTQPRDLSPGNSRLCLSFLAQLFSARNGFEGANVSAEPLRAPATVRVSEEVMPCHVPVVFVVDAGWSAGSGGSNGDARGSFRWSGEEREEVGALPAGEAVAFAVYVNNVLGDNAAVSHILPLNEFGGDLCERLADGLIVDELVKCVSPIGDDVSHDTVRETGEDEVEQIVTSALRSLDRRLSGRSKDADQERVLQLEQALEDGVARGYELKGCQSEAMGVIQGR